MPPNPQSKPGDFEADRAAGAIAQIFALHQQQFLILKGWFAAMLSVHSEGKRYTVFDDVLDDDQLQIAQDAVSLSTLAPALSPINRIHDGLAFKAYGPRGFINADLEGIDHDDVVQQLAAQCIRATGKDTGDDVCTWAYSSTYMAYTVGTQLSWHDDREDAWVGVFTFYLDDWSSHWGGELDLMDCDSRELPKHTNHEEGVVHAFVNATAVFPRTNRLAVLKAGTLHRVRRVDQLAGANIRRTISGSVWVAERAVADVTGANSHKIAT